MRLSRMSDRQLRRLIRNADVRFGLGIGGEEILLNRHLDKYVKARNVAMKVLKVALQEISEVQGIALRHRDKLRPLAIVSGEMKQLIDMVIYRLQKNIYW